MAVVTKTVAGAAAGMFVGALIMEVLNRVKPGLVKGAQDRVVGTAVGAGKKVAETGKGFAKSFREGYDAHVQQGSA